MQKLINFLSRYIATLSGFISLSIVLGLCVKTFSWRTKQLMFGTENKLLDSRFWYTPTDVQNFFAYIDSNIGKAGLNLYALTQVTLDVVFPIAYGTLLAALITLLYSAEAAQRLIIIPILAALADLGENFILAYLASNHSITVSSIAWVASVFTLLKWVMVCCSGLLILGGIIWKLKFS